MRKTLIAILAILFIGRGTLAQMIWVNEFHYDNAGGDVNEFVEIAAPGSFSDFSSIRLTLYNGADGSTYGSAHLLSTFAPGATSGGYTFYSKLISGIQNGAPDGLSLDQSGTVLQFLSYEGSFSATAGPALGLTSTDIAVMESEAGTAIGASLGLTGTGTRGSDFQWTSFTADSRASINSGQAITAIPEPSTYALIAGFGSMIFAICRRRNLRRS